VTRLAAALVAGALAVMAAACGGDDEDGGGGSGDAVRPQVDEIAPAIDAVEAELGGPQDFFEVTAGPQQVQLFVARDRATRAATYVYVRGELASVGDPVGASGGTFPGDAVDFDPDTILTQLDDELDEPDVVGFSIEGDGTGAVQYVAAVRSAQGGTIDVVLAADGEIQSVTAAE
jgi:hypothetical protein